MGTYTLLLANVATFAAQHFSVISTEQLASLRLHHATFNLSLNAHQLLTSLFIHTTFLHLTSILLPLLLLGTVLESRFGFVSVIAAYVLSGVLANGLALYVLPTKAMVSSGGSAAVLGLLIAATPLAASAGVRGLVEALAWGSFVVGRVLAEGVAAVRRKVPVSLVNEVHFARLGGAVFGGAFVVVCLLLFGGWGEKDRGEGGRMRRWREFKRDWYYRGR